MISMNLWISVCRSGDVVMSLLSTTVLFILVVRVVMLEEYVDWMLRFILWVLVVVVLILVVPNLASSSYAAIRAFSWAEMISGISSWVPLDDRYLSIA